MKIIACYAVVIVVIAGFVYGVFYFMDASFLADVGQDMRSLYHHSFDYQDANGRLPVSIDELANWVESEGIRFRENMYTDINQWYLNPNATSPSDPFLKYVSSRILSCTRNKMYVVYLDRWTTWCDCTSTSIRSRTSTDGDIDWRQ